MFISSLSFLLPLTSLRRTISSHVLDPRRRPSAFDLQLFFFFFFCFFLIAVGCWIAVELVLLRTHGCVTAATSSSSAGHARGVAALRSPRRLACRPRRSSLSSLLPLLSVLTSLAAVPAAALVRPAGVLPGETLSIPLPPLGTFAVVSPPAASHGALFVAAAALHSRRFPVAVLCAGNGPPASPYLPFLSRGRE